MAGDWLKWNLGLCDKPEIMSVANRLKVRPEFVAGVFMRAMEWVDGNVSEWSGDGHAFVTLASCPYNWLDGHLRLEGYTDAMIEAGWMAHRDGKLVFVNVAKHNGKSGKARALALDRKRTERFVKDVTLLSRKERDPSTLSLFSNSEGGVGGSPYPSLAQWMAQAKAAHPDWPELDIEASWNWYEANGWRTGKNPVRKWKACVNTCYCNWKSKAPSTPAFREPVYREVS